MTPLRAACFHLILMSCGLAPAAVVTLTPTADAFVTTGAVGNDLSGDNFGGGGALGVAAAGLPKGEYQSVIRFDLAAAKTFFDGVYGVGLWTLDQAHLQLTATPPNNSIFNGSGVTPANTAGLFNIEWMGNDSWIEGIGTPASPTTSGVTFNTLPGFLGTVESMNVGGQPFSFDGSTTTTTKYNMALSAGFLTDINAGNQASLHLSAADSSIAALWNARSVGAASNRPMLVLTVPEPGRAMLLGVALGLMLVRRRRRLH